MTAVQAGSKSDVLYHISGIFTNRNIRRGAAKARTMAIRSNFHADPGREAAAVSPSAECRPALRGSDLPLKSVPQGVQAVVESVDRPVAVLAGFFVLLPGVLLNLRPGGGTILTNDELLLVKPLYAVQQAVRPFAGRGGYGARRGGGSPRCFSARHSRRRSLPWQAPARG